MLRATLVVAVFSLILAAAPGCRSRSTHARMTAIHTGKLMQKELRSYHTVRSEYDGKVGYMKVYDVREGGGPSYPWRYLYDLEWNELGFIDQFGSAYRYHRYAEFQQEAHDTTMRVDRMPADSTENNVMRMLGLDLSRDNVTFPLATSADIGD
jgi:hypothetical protein